jgi:predicted nucleotidyltransferase
VPDGPRAVIGRPERRKPPDPYQRVIQRLNRRGVRYVVVGMSGINYYAQKSAETFATLDYDLFLEPTLPNVEKVVRVLSGLGFTIGTAAGRLEAGQLARVVRERKTLVATTPEGVAMEFLLEVSGFPFSELARDAATFTVQGVPIKVGRLTKLLQSKQLAGRPKDRAFLRRYHSLLKDESNPTG